MEKHTKKSSVGGFSSRLELAGKKFDRPNTALLKCPHPNPWGLWICYCNIVIYKINIYGIFIPVSSLKFLNPFNFLSDKSENDEMAVFCYY